jgi:ligand-binding SRPBCC domain-containing protein
MKLFPLLRGDVLSYRDKMSITDRWPLNVPEKRTENGMSLECQKVEVPPWARRWLLSAGIYNLAWGTLAIAFPHLLFDLAGAERVNYAEIWQCVGMIIGVYGIGYLIASADSRRHWPIVLVGLLGKIFGPIGFAMALLRGTFPPLFGLTILTNDIIWWVPFTMILLDAARQHKGEPVSDSARTMFVKETRIDAPPDIVFEFHESPDALTQLIPPWENMKVSEATGSLKPGSRVVLKGHLGFLPIQWIAIHTEYEPPHLFADRQESGPFAYWYHRHRFLSDGQGGTILRDEVEYAVPLGLIGRWFGGWFIRRKLDAMFAYRHEVTRGLIESGRWSNPSLAGQPS